MEPCEILELSEYDKSLIKLHFNSKRWTPIQKMRIEDIILYSKQGMTLEWIKRNVKGSSGIISEVRLKAKKVGLW